VIVYLVITDGELTAGSVNYLLGKNNFRYCCITWCSLDHSHSTFPTEKLVNKILCERLFAL